MENLVHIYWDPLLFKRPIKVPSNRNNHEYMLIQSTTDPRERSPSLLSACLMAHIPTRTLYS